MAAMAWYVHPYLWIGVSIFFLILFLLLLILLIFLAKKTHAIVEFKAMMKGWPIAQFYEENRYCVWRPVKCDAGIVIDKDFGAFVVNEKATYIDRLTKNIFLPFDASFGVGLNVHAAKLADDLQYIIKDEEQMKVLRNAIATNKIEESETIEALKTTINFGAIKSMMSAIIPHNINAKIEKVIASRMAGYGKMNVQQAILIFVSIFGAIALGALVLYLMLGK